MLHREASLIQSSYLVKIFQSVAIITKPPNRTMNKPKKMATPSGIAAPFKTR
jgi:hypothetical protein